ncbi:MULTISPECIES: DUF5302 domain-containing protein [Janibacter]|jgi:hypothetical protein|uniref:DUF5302 domain-containing protein n=1 Tax=Janibacter melonis TaxID=262209 RepID=A0A176QHA9_9MICO|nr:DUF5302 domain-containing protein [Janibacter melonis]MBD5831878.1 hypothetical protein [Janibacter melonis]MCB5991536.1 DUF5302 domain-containing protein [Janibacter melonis]MCM3553678.1 DUF5302 domain-containing protein [Janibacter melonis]OAB89062.1 hypothetical protein AWH69_01000 [Janibacter melonis]QFQ31173.1 hypothetical protein EEW87_013990 [Janibacter melonis]
MSKHESAPEDVKEKFRQALERKQAHAGRDVSAEGGHGKVESSHGPETSGSQQMFRRKSG